MRRVTFLWFSVLSSVFIITPCVNSQSRLVNLTQGQARGYKDPEDGIYIFYNIPYAKAPTGSERFKAPLPPSPWVNVYEAVDKGIICPQGRLMLVIPDSKTIQEDCLVANIYVPDTEKKQLPVVVYVHGGAYFIGWGDLLTPKNLAKSKEIIAVTFNYRLGAHGFLCLGTIDAPGNAGIKDQVALLRWIKKNIASFGGNPDEVTIAGYSAGSSAVDLLTISKITNGLFKRVIPESGANTAAFTVQSDPIRNAKEYAELITTDKFDDIYALEKFYKTVSYDKLTSVDVMNRSNSAFLLSPCIERDLGQEIFLEDAPVRILKSGNFKKVPMLYGFSKMEGLFRLPLFDQWKNRMNIKFSDFLPADLMFKNDMEKEQLAEKVKHFYFRNKLISEETILTYIDYFTDVMFAYPVLRSIKLQIEAVNDQVYLYEYSYVNKDQPIIPYTNVRGANHCAQTMAILEGFWNPSQSPDEKVLSEDLKRHKKLMREIWYNFITTGKPVPEGSLLPNWPPAGANWSPHMSLNETIQLKSSLLKDRALFWEDIYNKYYLEPIQPSPSQEHTEL